MDTIVGYAKRQIGVPNMFNSHIIVRNIYCHRFNKMVQEAFSEGLSHNLCFYWYHHEFSMVPHDVLHHRNISKAYTSASWKFLQGSKRSFFLVQKYYQKLYEYFIVGGFNVIADVT